MNNSLTSIKLFGQVNSTLEYVRFELDNRLEAIDSNLQLEVSNDLSELKDINELKLPVAFVDNHRICYEPEHPNLFFDRIIDLVMNNQKSTRYNVIVPSDFSDNSKTALNYAFENFATNAYSITLLHMHRPINVDEQGTIREDEIVGHKKGMLADLKEECINRVLESNLEVKIESSFVEGFAAEGIVSLTDNTTNCILVLGTTGEGRMIKSFLGSVSTAVVKNISCPVILIPPNTEVKKFQTFLYCSENLTRDLCIQEQLCALAKLHDTDIHILSLGFDNEDHHEEELQEVLELHYPKEKIHIKHKDEPLSSEAINNYASEIAADIIILSTQHRNMLQDLFHKSFSKEMAIKAKLPLLILHKQ